jgi:hypothetical protein
MRIEIDHVIIFCAAGASEAAALRSHGFLERSTTRILGGMIIVYPMLHEVGLIPLSELGRHFSTVAEKLDGGKWTGEAEQELLRVGSDGG